MKMTVLIPAHNEEKTIEKTVSGIEETLSRNKIDHDMLVVNDNSTDSTAAVIEGLKEKIPSLSSITNDGPAGYGMVIRCGLDRMKGDAVCITMADSSDDPADIVTYYAKLKEGYDCAFGSRFIKGARLVDYPAHKLLLNRIGNYFIKFLFGIRHNDITNAFKCYKRAVVSGVQPLVSSHFNLTVELPLKAIVRGYSFATVPISWTNRTEGRSKFKIKEMGSRYLSVIFGIFREKYLSKKGRHR